MFTDSIEVQYRSSQLKSILSNKGLAFNHILNDSTTEKAYMTNKTPQGQKHKADFSKWYEQSLNLAYPQENVQCPF